MTSYIIYGATEEKRLEKAHEICDEKKVDKLDITLIQESDESEPASSVGIKIVKNLIEKASFRPYKGESKAIIVKNAELLTIPAQNALLKTLEEPPVNTFIFLLTDRVGSLLPTIRSRCSEILLESDTAVSNDESIAMEEKWTGYKKSSINQALKTAEGLAKDKQKSIEALQDLVTHLHKKLLHTIDIGEKGQQVAEDLSNLEKALNELQNTNTNPRLVFEHFLLQLIS